MMATNLSVGDPSVRLVGKPGAQAGSIACSTHRQLARIFPLNALNRFRLATLYIVISCPVHEPYVQQNVTQQTGCFCALLTTAHLICGGPSGKPHTRSLRRRGNESAVRSSCRSWTSDLRLHAVIEKKVGSRLS